MDSYAETWPYHHSSRSNNLVGNLLRIQLATLAREYETSETNWLHALILPWRTRVFGENT